MLFHFKDEIKALERKYLVQGQAIREGELRHSDFQSSFHAPSYLNAARGENPAVGKDQRRPVWVRELLPLPQSA